MKCNVLVVVLILFVAAPASFAGEQTAGAEVVAWEAFCDQLKTDGAAILRAHPQRHEIDRAEGLRYLADQVATAVAQVDDRRNAALPLLRLGATTSHKWGLDGADAKYVVARVDGQGVYRLHGRLGDARIVAVQTASDRGEFRAFASTQRDGLRADADGRFELVIAVERPEDWGGAFLPSDPAANMLLVREYFGDWSAEAPSSFFVERLDASEAPPPLTMESAAALLDEAASVFASRAPYWLSRSERIRDGLANRVVGNALASGQGLAGNYYGSGAFELAPGEALVLTFDEPDALLWSVQLGNIWWESLDYLNHTASLNSEQAFVNADGRVRIVIANEDPGVANWLDAAGHPSGQILFRFQQTKNQPETDAAVVAFSSLRERLPSDTPDVGATQRAAEIAARRNHAARRWAP